MGSRASWLKSVLPVTQANTNVKISLSKNYNNDIKDNDLTRVLLSLILIRLIEMLVIVTVTAKDDEVDVEDVSFKITLKTEDPGDPVMNHVYDSRNKVTTTIEMKKLTMTLQKC